MLVTERYILPQEFKQDLIKRPVNWGFGMFSAATYYRTYSRQKVDGTQEQWADTVMRSVEGVMSIRKNWYKLIGRKWDERFWDQQAKQMAEYFFDMKVLPPGRGLWANGSRSVYELGSAALNNCSAVDVTNLAEDAAWVMDMLMMGVGVGFSTYSLQSTFSRPKHTHYEDLSPKMWDDLDRVTEDLRYELRSKQLNQTEYDKEVASIHDELINYDVFVVEDSREGWTNSTKALIQAYQDGSVLPFFYYGFVRDKGEPINGFGGTSSGPEPLIQLHNNIISVLEDRVDGKISDVRLVADVMNMIGVCVVAGNVRRSAEIATGLPGDTEFINLKNYELNPERGGWGYMSNNSVSLTEPSHFELLPDIADSVRNNGEPGILNVMNMQKYGRFKEKKEDLATLSNPCAEIPLESYELCNLVEVFPTRCETDAEVLEAMRIATLYASTISLLPTHSDKSNEVIARNRRIGVSISGVADWVAATSTSHVTKMLRLGYEQVVTPTNKKLNAAAGVPASVRLTTVKPSGTISILAGVSPGMHQPYFRYGVRRMRVSANSPTATILTVAGVPYEDDLNDPGNTLVFEFPLEMGRGQVRAIDEVSVWEQAMMVAWLQREWADNMVSNTINFNPETEGPMIEQVISMIAPQIKSLSLLPDQSSAANPYPQAPFERTGRAEYRERMKEITNIDWSSFYGSDGVDSKFCANDICEI